MDYGKEHIFFQCALYIYSLRNSISALYVIAKYKDYDVLWLL